MNRLGLRTRAHILIRHLLASLLAVLGCSGIVHAGAKGAEGGSQPNIVVILSDDMGYSDIGAFGGEIRTPSLDRLAGNGMVFTQAYNASRCCPTRASLMSGLYPHQAGVGGMLFPTEHPGYSEHLADDAILLAEVLREAGYGTYMAGKWHLAPRTYDRERDVEYWPTRRGFDHFYGTIAGYGSFWDPFMLCRDETLISPERDPDYQPETFYYTDAITDNAIAFLKQHHDTRTGEPFFLYLSYTAAHWPLHAFEEDIASYAGVYEDGYAAIHRRRVERLRELGLIPEVGDIAEPIGDWDAIANKPLEAALMATYAAMITRMDAGIGALEEYLASSGQLENTVIFYLQDNGSNAEDWFGKETPYPKSFKPMAQSDLQTASLAPMQTRDGRPVRTGYNVWPGPPDTYTALKENWANVSNAPFLKFKHYSHEGGISTPLIVHWPSGIDNSKTRRLVRNPVHVIDIMPTCLDLAGVAQPSYRKGVPVQPLEGISLLPLLTGNGAWHRKEPLFWEHESSRAIRDGKWKLVAEEGAHWELFDMESDRGEMQDLALVYSHITERLAAEWYHWAERARVLPLGGWFDRMGQRSLFLRQGDALPVEESPLLVGRAIFMQARILSGPVEGVILSQGTGENGFSLCLENDKLSLAIRRDGQLDILEMEGVPDAPFKVVASLSRGGRMMVGINDKRYYSSLNDGIRSFPEEGLSIGHDAGLPVGEYTGSSEFAGQLGLVTVRGTWPDPGAP